MHRLQTYWNLKGPDTCGQGPPALAGVEIDLDAQIELLEKVCTAFRHEFTGGKTYRGAVSTNAGTGYGYIEAQVLHAFIRYFRPRRILEVGSGVSTVCMSASCELNRLDTGLSTKITCVDPFPSPTVRALRDVHVVERPVQTLPLSAFEELGSGDLLFIASTHAVKVGGDVNFLVLEVLPRLRQGVFVHFHDIYFPYDYPRDVLQTFYPAHESALVHAFLIGNDRVRILFCLSHLHYERAAKLKEILPDYDPEPDENGLSIRRPFQQSVKHFPSSLYLEVVCGDRSKSVADATN